MQLEMIVGLAGTTVLSRPAICTEVALSNRT